MREWLSGGAPPCQGGGRGFESRLALFIIYNFCVRDSNSKPEARSAEKKTRWVFSIKLVCSVFSLIQEQSPCCNSSGEIDA